MEGPANTVHGNVERCASSLQGGHLGRFQGCCSHGVVLRVVAEALRDNGVAEEEGKVREHVFAGRGDGAGSRELPSALLIDGLH